MELVFCRKKELVLESLSLQSARGAAQKLLLELADGWGRSGGLGDVCAYAVRTGGKRLRPTIAIALGRMLSGPTSPASVDQALCEAATGIELLHLASLIADDLPCMDDDDERRGQPAVHRKFSESSALLASYALIAHGYELMTRAALQAPSPTRAIEAVSRIARAGGLLGATQGQFFDLEIAAGRPADRSLMLKLKTGALFEMAFLCAWGFGGSSSASLDGMTALADSFGLAFQCLDDLQDAFEDGSENCVTDWGWMGVLEHAHLNLELFRKALIGQGWYWGPMRELCDWIESPLQQLAQTSAVSAASAGTAEPSDVLERA